MFDASVVGASVLILLMFAVAIVAAAGIGRLLAAQTATERMQSISTLNSVMGATTRRLDREETMGLILERTCRELQAQSGSLHLPNTDPVSRPSSFVTGRSVLGGAGGLHLVHALGVTDLARLANIPVADPLLTQMRNNRSAAHMAHVTEDTNWAALGNGNGKTTIAAVLIGSAHAGESVLALAWPRRVQAASVANTLQAIARYTGQVLAEFDSLEKRARDFESLSESMQHHEMLVSTVAHDMGNHMSTLSGLLGLRLMDLEAAADKQMFGEMQGHLNVIDALRIDLVAPGREVAPEPVSIESLVELVPSMMARRVRPRQLTFELDVPTGLPRVWGERIGLMRVLDNLLVNAVKYNRNSGKVWLRIRLHDREMEFQVGDTGPGIAAQKLAQLFEFGYRVDGAGQVKGHGFGLWSCEQIIAAHGGRIWAESETDVGSRFFFTVPLVPN